MRDQRREHFHLLVSLHDLDLRKVREKTGLWMAMRLGSDGVWDR